MSFYWVGVTSMNAFEETWVWQRKKEDRESVHARKWEGGMNWNVKTIHPIVDEPAVHADFALRVGTA